MEKSLEMLATQQVDPEVFRRVWARVMPDQRDSPIVVVPRETNQSRKTKQTDGYGKKPAVKENGRIEDREEEELKNMMELLWEGSSRLQMLNKKSGGRNRQLQAMAADYRRAMRQLETSWFLLTGQRGWKRPRENPREEPLDTGLRSQFLWEQKWRALCSRIGEQTEDVLLARMCRRLAEESLLHVQLIRQILEGERRERY